MATVICDKTASGMKINSGMPSVFEFTLGGQPIFIDALCTHIEIKNRVQAQLQNTFNNIPYAISFGDGPSDIQAVFAFVGGQCMKNRFLADQVAIQYGFKAVDVYTDNRFLPNVLFRTNSYFILSIEKLHIECLLIASSFTLSTKDSPATSGVLFFRGYPMP